MSNYLYNGVELPALPEWDKETYPYAAIYTNATGTIFKFYCDAAGETVSSSGTCLIMSNGRVMNAENGVWVAGAGGVNCTPIWANHDVLYSSSAGELSGQLFLAASEPVPVSIVSGIDTISMTLGWLVGKRIASQRRKKRKEPVAYLYNGKELPPLPDRDKEQLPYVSMYWHTTTGKYVVYAHSMKLIRKQLIDATLGAYFLHVPEAPGLCWKMGEYKPSVDTAWVNAGKIADGWGDEDNDGVKLITASGSSVFEPLWTNYDSMNEDGTLFFAASEPVPVY